MEEVSTIGLDIAKAVFHAHGADARGQMAFSRRLTRPKLLEFFVAQPRCVVIVAAGPRFLICYDLRVSFAGRLSWDGKTLDYCTGQYFCTEYRAAACAGLSLALRRYWRADGIDVQTMAQQCLGRGIAARWFK